jgi:molybdopterin converting factor small subunit
MDEEQEVLVRRAIFGKQVEDFLSSDIGRYLLVRAADQAETAMDKLKVCVPTEGKTVQALQNDIYVAESIRTWLAQAIQDGINALNIIESPE